MEYRCKEADAQMTFRFFLLIFILRNLTTDDIQRKW